VPEGFLGTGSSGAPRHAGGDFDPYQPRPAPHVFQDAGRGRGFLQSLSHQLWHHHVDVHVHRPHRTASPVDFSPAVVSPNTSP